MSGFHHTLTAGQTLGTLARQHGLADAAAIYGAPENESIRRARPTPESVKPGDRVFIPAPREPEDDIPVHGEDMHTATPAPDQPEGPGNADIPPSQPLGDAKTATVCYVARNLLNTTDLRPGGHSWFSA